MKETNKYLMYEKVLLRVLFWVDFFDEDFVWIFLKSLGDKYFLISCFWECFWFLCFENVFGFSCFI